MRIGVRAAFLGLLATMTVGLSTGMLDYGKYVTDQGGINGIKVKMLWEETRAEIPRAISAHKRFNDAGVVMEMGLSSP